jgi:3-oxoacyl-[acyl-carrier protein] reductase
LEALTDEVWRKILGVNVMGTFYASRAAAKVMLEQKSGCIVNMASVSGLSGLGSSIPYSVSKAGVISLTKTFARALAPHVRVNAIAPGVVDTRWVEGRTEFVERARSRTPFGRVATPADVAEVALALVTNAGFVTGQVIVVDGGLTI